MLPALPSGPMHLVKPAHSRTGRFPSTHSTECCLSNLKQLIFKERVDFSTYACIVHASGFIVNRKLAGVPGLEPETTESKSVVLPLHHTPTYSTG